MKKKMLFLFMSLCICGCEVENQISEFDYTLYDYTNDNVSTKIMSVNGKVENFSDYSEEDKVLILALLENYILKNNLSGIGLYDDATLVKFNDRIKIPTKRLSNGRYEYVSDYGFAIISEGEILSPFQTADNYSNYYHLHEAKSPKNFSFMNDKGSIINKYHQYISSSYFQKKLSSFKDSYVYYPSLANELNMVENDYRPIPLTNGIAIENANKYTLTNQYRVYVRIGEDIVYNSASSNLKISSYINRQVQIEDYLTPFKYLYMKKNNFYNSKINLLGAGSIKGLNEYYESTENGFSQTSFDNVGIKANVDEMGNAYLDFTFNNECNPYQAMTYLSNPLYAPIPEEFINEIDGINNMGGVVGELTPVDTLLSTGPYVLETLNEDEFIFKKNTLISSNVLGGSKRYKIEGIYVDILKEVSYNPLAAYNAFKENKIDEVVVPYEAFIDEYDSSNTQISKSNLITKLSINSCDETVWEELFGENGRICKTSKDKY